MKRGIALASVICTIIIAFIACSKEEDPTSGTIEISYPNGGESFKIGETMDIEWRDSLPENVKIELMNNENVEQVIATSAPSSGLYIWTIPNNVSVSTNYRIRIKSVDDNTIFDSSDGDFSINPNQPEFITVTAPNGGETWSTSQNQTVSWDDNISANVRIKLFYDGTFSGEIPGTYTGSSAIIDMSSHQVIGSGDKYKIRIESADDASVYDESDNYFTITSGTTT